MISRRKKVGEKFDARFPAYFAPSQLEVFKEAVGEGDASKTIRALVNGWLDGKIELDFKGENIVTPLAPPALPEPANAVPIYGSTPGGPWDFTIDGEKSMIPVPDWLRKHLGIQDGDGFIRVNGHSMKGVGISSGALVLMREFQIGEKPVTGQIVLVKVRTGLGDVTTLKVWTLDDENKPVLRDGNGKGYPLPPGGKNPTAISVAHGVIGPVEMKYFPLKD